MVVSNICTRVLPTFLSMNLINWFLRICRPNYYYIIWNGHFIMVLVWGKNKICILYTRDDAVLCKMNFVEWIWCFFFIFFILWNRKCVERKQQNVVDRRGLIIKYENIYWLLITSKASPSKHIVKFCFKFKIIMRVEKKITLPPIQQKHSTDIQIQHIIMMIPYTRNVEIVIYRFGGIQQVNKRKQLEYLKIRYCLKRFIDSYGKQCLPNWWNCRETHLTHIHTLYFE